ncbi:MAG: hypothetical protein HOP02_06810 [Methylococcaceae bacterium]|nr:hypothetical protein [Methylococcaceae bacterium]
MLRKTASTVALILLLGSALPSGVFANDNVLAVKTDAPYNNPQNSALRTGTENWEQPQWSFFVVPGIFMGLALLVLLFKGLITDVP